MTTVRVVTRPGVPRIGKVYVLSVPQGTGQPDHRLDQLFYAGKRDGVPIWRYGNLMTGQPYYGSLRDAVLQVAQEHNLMAVQLRMETV